jgi:hypothetical protein
MDVHTIVENQFGRRYVEEKVKWGSIAQCNHQPDEIMKNEF